MKLKIYRFIMVGVFLISLLGISTACDPLGIEPTTQVDEDRFWTNPQLARSYVNSYYFWTQSASGDTFQSEQWSDNAQGNAEQDWNTYRQESFNKRQYDENSGIIGFTAPWTDAYKKVYNVNLGIEKINSSSAISENLKNQLLAESYFFRAFVYFDMIKFWGTVPYVDKALTIDDETYLPQNKRELVFDNILSDLNESVSYFQGYSGRPEIGLINTDVATAFISRVALYAANAADASAQNLYSDDAKGLFKFEKNSQHYYQIAYNAAKSLIGKYSLEDNYVDLFTSPNSHMSSESIWPVMFKENQRSGFNPTSKNGPDHLYYGGTEAASNAWNIRSGLFPTQDLVDSYLQKDEVDGQWKNWWETSQAQAMGVTINADGEIEGESANYRGMFANRDERFYATVTYDGSYMGPEEEPYSIQTWIDNTDPANTLRYCSLHTGYRYLDRMYVAPVNRASAQTITGYYSRKYSQFNIFNNDGTLNWGIQRQTTFFNIRYAEVLLNYVEALNEMQEDYIEDNISIKARDENEILDAFNQIRYRAGLPGLTTLPDQGEMRELIKKERRIEFICEGQRYHDLRRWGDAYAAYNLPVLGLNIKARKSERDKFYEITTLTDDKARRYFDYKNYFYPIPKSALNRNDKLVQNPGW